ncbi:MAG: orotidine-5'-phosphate decarboxylase [Dehalococcoidia bacterium]|nr:orotidine-5'-phosphate decarboxylase [Dehalococcoidia bacterium]
MHPYIERLRAAMGRSRSLVCVGLDPEPARMPLSDVAAFNRAIIDATADLVCAFKPNLGHYEALGIPGLSALEETIEHIRSAAPGVVLIGDAKRGDVGSTSAAYARAMFEVWGFDATTVNAYGGGESLAPFLEYSDRGVYVWCRSSNPGAAELQDVLVDSGETVYERLAARVVGWESRAAVGLVAGATYPADVAALRALAPEASILAPGVGAQGGDLAAAVRAGAGSSGRGIIIPSSRAVLYASESRGDFAEAARDAADRLRRSVNDVLDREGLGW